MKKFLVFLLLMFLAAGCASQDDQLRLAYTAVPLTQTQAAMNAPTPMPAVLEFAVAVEQAKATAAAVEATQIWIYGQLTATQAAKEERATAQAAVVTEQAFRAETTATAQAFFAHQAATERSFMVTSTSQAIGTATAYPQTATAQSSYATQTEQAWQTTATMDAAYGAAAATAAYGNAQSVELTVQRERATNMTRAWLPWMGFAVLIGLITIVGIRWSRTRVVMRDAFGASGILIIDEKVIDPDKMPGPALITSRAGVDLVPGDEETTKRAQLAQMLRSMPGGKIEQPPFMFEQSSARPAIEVVEPETVRGWIEDVGRQADEQEV